MNIENCKMNRFVMLVSSALALAILIAPATVKGIAASGILCSLGALALFVQSAVGGGR